MLLSNSGIMNYRYFILFSAAIFAQVIFSGLHGQPHNIGSDSKMMYGDISRTGTPFSKDPHVIKFRGSYLMYYSIPSYRDISNPVKGWGIGIAESRDLIYWKKIGEITPATDYEEKGLCAPCARVIKGKVHLFYQTYGNGKNDAICHAWSDDGINFLRDETNPVFHPDGSWNCGRAIDAEVIKHKGKYYLYYATRDPDFRIQMQGVAVAPGFTVFKREDWKNLSTSEPILKPELPWEKDCIEGASVIKRGKELYMFYAGAYNNAPQQVGVAVSTDAVHWNRLSDKPFLANGKPGEWNSSESGHPHIFKDRNGKTYLFFQGNNDNGKTWYISKVEVAWGRQGPYLKLQ
jgi:beta-1,2-mannobiose phosphorylase / 1,2-beta-oligomannan phosphorylase